MNDVAVLETIKALQNQIEELKRQMNKRRVKKPRKMIGREKLDTVSIKSYGVLKIVSKGKSTYGLGFGSTVYSMCKKGLLKKGRIRGEHYLTPKGKQLLKQIDVFLKEVE